MLKISNFRAVSLPIYDLSVDKVVGYELLSRGPSGPLEMPDTFFKVSLESGILEEVDLICFKTCMNAANSYDPNTSLHVNLFPSTILAIAEDELTSYFPERRKLDGFCIEIVEHQRISDILRLKKKLNKLRESGVQLAVDDVGFGASSLESLIVLEPDVIKIDRKYVTDAYKDYDRAHCLERLVSVARALGAKLVAEGVCSEEDRRLLQSIGVLSGQGPLWGPLQ